MDQMSKDVGWMHICINNDKIEKNQYWMDLRGIIKSHHITETLGKARRDETRYNEQKKVNTFGIFSVEYCTISR